MRVAFKALKDDFKSASIHFTTNGNDRILESDLISYIEGCSIEQNCGFLSGSNLFEMGCFSYSWSQLPTNTSVGRYCSIASGLKVLGARHPMEWISTSSFTYDNNFSIFKDINDAEGGVFKPETRPSFDSKIVLGHDVWIGAGVTLKPGITIGTGSVIAASSIVVKDVPPYSVVGGNPAKIIKQRFDCKTVNKLLASEWWNYKFTDFFDFDIRDPIKFCDQLAIKIKTEEIKKFQPIKITLENIVGAKK